MSNEPGNLPEGESASNDVVPLSRPVEANELDDGWGDEALVASPHAEATAVDTATAEATGVEASVAEVTESQPTQSDAPVEPAAVNAPTVDESNATAKQLSSMLPPSLSPIVLSTDDDHSVAPPEPAEAKPNRKRPTSIVPSRRRFGKKLGAGYVLVPLVGLAAGIALIVLRPKPIAPDKSTSAQLPAVAAQIQAPIAVSPPALPAQAMEPPATTANAEPVDAAAVPPTASVAAAAGPVPSASAASGDSFLNAFQRNAAKSNAKWAEVKRESAKSPSGSADASKAASAKPGATKPAAPGQADPLDVLKRLEGARKSKQ